MLLPVRLGPRSLCIGLRQMNNEMLFVLRFCFTRLFEFAVLQSGVSHFQKARICGTPGLPKASSLKAVTRSELETHTHPDIARGCTGSSQPIVGPLALPNAAWARPIARFPIGSSEEDLGNLQPRSPPWVAISEQDVMPIWARSWRKATPEFARGRPGTMLEIAWHHGRLVELALEVRALAGARGGAASQCPR